MEEGMKYPLGILVEIAGPELEEDIEGVIERRIHEYTNYIEGLLSQPAVRHLGEGVQESLCEGLYHACLCRQCPYCTLKSARPLSNRYRSRSLQTRKKISARYAEAMAVYAGADAGLGLTDDDVDVFYGCALCQSFAPATSASSRRSGMQTAALSVV